MICWESCHCRGYFNIICLICVFPSSKDIHLHADRWSLETFSVLIVFARVDHWKILIVLTLAFSNVMNSPGDLVVWMYFRCSNQTPWFYLFVVAASVSPSWCWPLVNTTRYNIVEREEVQNCAKPVRAELLTILLHTWCNLGSQPKILPGLH